LEFPLQNASASSLRILISCVTLHHHFSDIASAFYRTKSCTELCIKCDLKFFRMERKSTSKLT
jgi:hypothetical protein